MDPRKPKPNDPLWHRRGCWINANCACGRNVSIALDDVIARHKLNTNMLLYELLAKLRCKVCGQAPSFSDVTERPKIDPRYTTSN